MRVGDSSVEVWPLGDVERGERAGALVWLRQLPCNCNSSFSHATDGQKRPSPAIDTDIHRKNGLYVVPLAVLSVAEHATDGRPA